MSELGLPEGQVREIIRRALVEDLPWGDVTSEAVIPGNAGAAGRFAVRETGIVCGLTVAALVFAEIDASIAFRPCRIDGQRISAGDILAEIDGPARGVLTGERTALNFLQRMSGIATATARYVAAVAGTGASIVDTRKTAPGLRLLDKYAVRCGGGANHRFSLSDAVLIKDNHLALAGAAGDALTAAVRRARSSIPHTVKVEVEVDRLDQIEPALAAGADIILLDNMAPAELRAAVDLIRGRALTEASGGITLETVRAVAESGVNLISVGALTHSVRALDVSLEL